MDYSVECQITSQKNSMYCPYHVDNIMTYVEREYMQGRPFTKFQKCDPAIRIILPLYKNFFIGRANDLFKIKHDNFNNTPF